MLSKKSEFPHVSIIILNWNGWIDTIECLESLFQINYPNYNVIVVDNASSDNSIKKIREYCLGKIKVTSEFIKYNFNNKPIHILEYSKEDIKRGDFLKEEISFLSLPSNKKITLIINDKNYMFVEGNNIPIKYYILKRLKTDYILLLNNDTAVEKDFLNELIDVAKTDKKIGIIGPRICYYDNPNLTEWPWLQNIKDFPIKAPRNYLNGAAFLFKIELIKNIGLLDTRFIHYFEEIDYCLSAHEHGYKIIYVPTKDRVLHKVAVSHKKVPGLEIYFRARNYFLTIRKHYSLSIFLLFFINYFSKQIFIEFKKYPKNKKHILKGVINGLWLILKDKSLLLKK